MIIDVDEQPVEEIDRVKSGKAPSTRASVPMELGCVTILVSRCVHPPGSSPNPILLGCYGGLPK